MNLGQIEVFVAIIETGSLTEAAEAVGLTQSAVSYSLAKLEAELGVTLLERGRQGVTLTRIGEEVLGHARDILAQIEIIRQKTARERGLTIGKLRFGCVPTVPPRLLTGILRDFQQKYPDIEIVLFEGTPRELVEWLETGVVDMATVTQPGGFPLSVPFVQAEVVVIVSAQHPLAARTDISPASLAHETIIGPKAEYGVYSAMHANPHLSIPRLHHEVSSPATIFAMVRQNMGVALVPRMLLDNQAESIIALPLQNRLFVEIYLASRTSAPAAEAFMESAAGWARSHGFSADSA